MLYHLLYPLKYYFIGFNVFRYITFRASYALLTAMAVSLVLGPVLIAFHRRQGHVKGGVGGIVDRHRPGNFGVP